MRVDLDICVGTERERQRCWASAPSFVRAEHLQVRGGVLDVSLAVIGICLPGLSVSLLDSTCVSVRLEGHPPTGGMWSINFKVRRVSSAGAARPNPHASARQSGFTSS